MSKQEFLQRLRETLTGEVPGNVIEENIRFYEEYISSEAGKGSGEEEIIASIGDPRLIAKTIIEANENASDHGKAYYESYSESRRNVYEDQEDFGRQIHYFDLSKWYWKALAFLVLFLLGSSVF